MCALQSSSSQNHSRWPRLDAVWPKRHRISAEREEGMSTTVTQFSAGPVSQSWKQSMCWLPFLSTAGAALAQTGRWQTWWCSAAWTPSPWGCTSAATGWICKWCTVVIAWSFHAIDLWEASDLHNNPCSNMAPSAVNDLYLCLCSSRTSSQMLQRITPHVSAMAKAHGILGTLWEHAEITN